MAISVQKPTSQKSDARPISFLLDDRKSVGRSYSVDLVIRPEDLVRTDPSRISVQQTLGGAWADHFGTGIPTITISGHTGWKRRLGVNEERDGPEQFQYLFETVFTKWHDLRKEAIRAGEDPDTVRLVFADYLDNFAAVVAPTSFTLRRSRSRPLLSQYQIAMTVLTLDIDLPFNVNADLSDKRQLEKAGITSLSASIDELTAILQDIHLFIDGAIVTPVRDFLQKTIRLYESVRTAIAEADDIAGTLIGVARMTAAAGMNIFRTINAITSSTNQVRARVMQVANAYSNIFCVMRNALQQQQFYTDYNPMFGSSNCSSTAGGRPISPLSGVNPFYLFTPSNRTPPVTISEGASNEMKSISGSDVALSPIAMGPLTASLAAISSGMQVE